MNAVFTGRLSHCRLAPTRHAFSYRMFWLALDLDTLPETIRAVRGLARQPWALASIVDRDYGGTSPHAGQSIRSKIDALLESHDLSAERITLVTIPRIGGYVFNPVSFYLCMDADERLTALICEVRNTFGDMHHYIAEPEATDDGACAFSFDKQFYVSPFFDVDGSYEIRLQPTMERFELSIVLTRHGERVFTAAMTGVGQPLTTRRFLTVVAQFPLFAATIMARIHWHAGLLRLIRRIRTHERPEPTHPNTIPRTKRRWTHRLRAALLRIGRRHGDGSTSTLASRRTS